MQTSATLHVQRCSVPGCLNDAQVTLAYGKYATAPKGICSIHTKADLDAKERQRKEDNELLAFLGFDVKAA